MSAIDNVLNNILGKGKLKKDVLGKAVNLKHHKHELKEGIWHEEQETPEYEEKEEKSKRHRG